MNPAHIRFPGAACLKLSPRRSGSLLRRAVWAILLFAGAAGLTAAQAPDAPGAASAAADLAAFEAEWKRPAASGPEKLTPREQAMRREAHARELIRRGEAFLERHPDSPLRWNVVSRLMILAPPFTREWGAEDWEGKPAAVKVDEAAAAAWMARRAELEAALRQAPDVPEDVKQALAQTDAVLAAMASNSTAFRNSWTGGGKTLPDFVVESAEGQPVGISGYRGKTVVLTFWATSCGPCVREMPENQALAARYQDQDVVVLAVCVMDTRERFERWLKIHRAKYPNIVWLFNPAGKNADDPLASFYPAGIPSQLVIAPDGRVMGALAGYAEGERILDMLLARAGVKVDPAVVAKGAADLARRERPN